MSRKYASDVAEIPCKKKNQQIRTNRSNLPGYSYHLVSRLLEKRVKIDKVFHTSLVFQKRFSEAFNIVTKPLGRCSKYRYH